MARDERRDELHSSPLAHRSGLDRATRHPSKPSAYAHYQKLVQDFQALEDELQTATAEHDAVQSQVASFRAHERTSAQVTDAEQRRQWETRDREARVESIVRKRVEVEALQTRAKELAALELRLEAELQVLEEKQEQHARSEASRIEALVHAKTHVFEAELAKGRMDLDFIAQVVKRTHSSEDGKQQQQQSQQHRTQQQGERAREKEPLQVLAAEIQERRRLEFERAVERLNARLLAFEHEKEALSQKAHVIRIRKQRALEILTSNQQEAIKTFFSTSPASETDTLSESTSSSQTLSAHSPTDALRAQPERGTEVPQLDFNAILESLNQSGLQVEQIQSARAEQASARQFVELALRNAQANVQEGDARIEALERMIAERRRYASALLAADAAPERASLYDGSLRIESYAPAQYEAVYFVRALVFAWAEEVAVRSASRPAKKLLEKELERWCVTHGVIERESNLRARSALAYWLLASIIVRCMTSKSCLTVLTVVLQNEVLDELARDIHRELEASCKRVRASVSSVLKDVLFPRSATQATRGRGRESATASKSSAQESTQASPPPLSRVLFSSVFEQLKTTRNQCVILDATLTRESVQPLHLSSQHVKKVSAATQSGSATNVPQTLPKSPKKKRFGLFSASKPSESTTAIRGDDQAAAMDTPHSRFVLDKYKVDIVELRADTTTRDGSTAPSPSLLTSTASEKKLWQQMLVEVDRVAIPSSFSHPSAVEVSSDARVCVVGTASGEVLVWDLQRTPPLLLRSYSSPSKSPKASVSRIALSASGTRILTLNQLHAVRVLSLQRASGSGQHASGCFAVDDPRKWKPLPLESLVEINADACARPAVTEEVRQLVPIDKSASTAPAPPVILCATFHSSSTLLGEQTSVLCGVADGDILKINMAGTHPSDVAARFDAPLPSDLANRELRVRDIQREFFCGHKHPVLFALSRHVKRKRSSLLSIDSDATILEWEYDTDHFSGCGWFVPSRRYRLSLDARDNTDGSTETQPRGVILQIAATADKTRVVLMVFFAAGRSATTKKRGRVISSTGRVRFYQLLLLADSVHVAPTQIQLDVDGASPAPSAPPRFTLTTTALPAIKTSLKGPSASSSHFLFALIHNTVQILSLRSGESCCAPIRLQQSSEPSVEFDAISVSSRWERKREAHCTMVVTSDRHRKLLVFRFKQQQQEEQTEATHKAQGVM
ncbi:hypothetical protein PybrP1_004471 [[Pythium] brassicae (nom. inval.)]|nr:hypothetical protein PybrP1_004471 [[Pythium] brassicae (nom. inval.)]